MFPDYKNCPVNLACSVLKEFGAAYTHPTLAFMDALMRHTYQNVVVILLDGMGMDALEYHLAADGFFRRTLKGEMTSVFPPTTVAATTSIETGLTPAEHGWLGWTLYFEEVDKLVNVFPNVDKYTNRQAADYHVAERCIPYESIHEKINGAGVGRSHVVAPYGPGKVRDADEFFARIRALCTSGGRKYIYAYWDEPDSLMHDTGCRSQEANAYIRMLEEKTERLADELSDTLLIITADHGHLDVSYSLITDYPEIEKMLVRPLSIESRAAVFYIKDDYLNVFPAAFREAFGKDFNLYTSEEIRRMELFGNGTPHKKFDAFVGDFLAAATGETCLIYDRTSKQFVSTHAGLDAREMRIPFIALEKP